MSVPNTVIFQSPVVDAASINRGVFAAQSQQANLVSQADRGDIIGLAEFHDLAGIKRHGQLRHNPVSLQQRLTQSRPYRLSSRRTANAIHLDTEDQDEHLHAISSDVLGALHGGGQSELEDLLLDRYDVLERHTLLRYALSAIDESDFKQNEKERLKSSLTTLLTELMDKHGDTIRVGLKNKNEFESALGEMDALSASSNSTKYAGSLTELRAQYGSRSNGKSELGLTPMGLAKSLMDRFGATNFIGALGGLRSKMASEFRTRPADRAGPRLWLSLSDAASFNVVQSSFALAGDLRRDLSERANVVSKTSQAETALALLGVAEQGHGRAEPLIAQIANSTMLTALQQFQLYQLTGQAIEKMPMTVWQKDSSKRMSLIDELRSMASKVCDKMSRTATPAEQLEKKMRGIVQHKGQHDEDDAEQGREEQQSDDDAQTFDACEG